MKFALSLLISFLAIGNLTFAQDYQTIRSNQINYFGTTLKNYFLATRTDSTEFDGIDSTFYSYQTLRETQDDTCFFRLSSPWTGEKIIIKPDGTNLFFNKDLDTITIETQAVLNDTFLVYSYTPSTWIKGTVTEMDTLTILEELDSVKTIELFSNSSDFELEEPYFKIGKNHGFISVFPFYSFPNQYRSNEDFNAPLTLMGSQFPRIGITKRTIGEIYNHEIGDEINYRTTTYNVFGDYQSSLYELDVIEKEIWGTDSVHYVFEKKSQIRSEYIDHPELNNTEIFTEDWEVTYFNLSDYLPPYLPEEYYFEPLFDDNSEGFVKSNTLSISPCGKIQEDVQYTYHFINMDTTYTGCDFEYPFGNSIYTKSYIEDIGGEYYINGFVYDGFVDQLNGIIEWFSNAGGDCGENFFVGLTGPHKTPELKLYPNPMNDHLVIEFNYFSEEPYEVIVRDLSGKIILMENYHNQVEKTQLNTSSLSNGVYTVSILTQGKTFTYKVIK